MNEDQKKLLVDVRDSLRHLAEISKGVQQPTRAILSTQIFIITQKVRLLLGEKDLVDESVRAEIEGP